MSQSTESQLLQCVEWGYREIRNIKSNEDFRAKFPLRLVEVKDEVSDMFAELPPEFEEQRYFIMNGNVKTGTVDTAIHADMGLVNLSVMLTPQEFFKKRAINRAVETFMRFVRTYVPEAIMSPVGDGNYAFPLEAESLVLQLRVRPGAYVGMAVMERQFSGL